MPTNSFLQILSPRANEPPAGSGATPDCRGDHPVLDFDDSSAETAQFTSVLPAVYSGGDIEVKLRVSFTSATSGNTVMSVAWGRITNLDTNVPATAKTVTIASPTTNGDEASGTITFASTEIDDVTAGDLFRIQVARLPNDVGDTASGDVELRLVEIREV